MSETRQVAIVMSRMARLITPEAVWLSGLRACLRQVHERQNILLVCPGTAGSDFVSRGAQRLGINTQVVSDDNVTQAGSSKDQILIEQADEVLCWGFAKTETFITC